MSLSTRSLAPFIAGTAPSIAQQIHHQTSRYPNLQDLRDMASEMHDTKRPRLSLKAISDFATTFDVLVGKDLTRFTVHENQLTRRSKFFRDARNVRELRSPKPPVTLNNEDDSPEIFVFYLQCVYTGCVHIPEEMANQIQETDLKNNGGLVVGEGNGPGEASTGGNPASRATAQYERDAYITLARLHELAYRLGDISMANLASDEMVRICTEFYNGPGAGVACYVWDYRRKSTALRDLIHEFYTRSMNDRKAAELRSGNWPASFLQNLVRSHTAASIKQTNDIGLYLDKFEKTLQLEKEKILDYVNWAPRQLDGVRLNIDRRNAALLREVKALLNQQHRTFAKHPGRRYHYDSDDD